MIVVALFLLYLPVQAQSESVNSVNVQGGGSVILADPMLDQILQRHINQNRKKGGIDGYRIQLYFNSGPKARDEANKLKAEVLSEYPEVPVYIIFQYPFYKVRVGDFRSKSDALPVYFALKKKYDGAYIVKDVIKPPPLETNDD